MGRRFKFVEVFSDIKNCVFSINKMIFWYQKFDSLIPSIFWFVNKMSDIKKSFLVSKVRFFDIRKWLFDIRYSKWFLYHKLLIPEIFFLDIKKLNFEQIKKLLNRFGDIKNYFLIWKKYFLNYRYQKFIFWYHKIHV